MDNTAVDRLVYEELLPWLPKDIVDCHVHVGLREHIGLVKPDRYREIWALEVASHQSWEELRDNYRRLFPDQNVSVLAFGGVYREVHIEQNNAYVLAGSLDSCNKARALFVTRPEWDAFVVETALAQGFVGIKPYPDLASSGQECSIYDFLPRSHLAVLERVGGSLMLHLPRAGRLGDAENIREVLEIHDKYPSIKIILAHIGRAYCLPTVRKGLPALADTRIYFDTAANLNADVFQYALEIVGPSRILFGSDLPVTMMRGMREHVGERYINYTSGDYSWNTNRKGPAEEACYTYFLYEELKALVRAVERAGLGREAMDLIMYSNSARLFGFPV